MQTRKSRRKDRRCGPSPQDRVKEALYTLLLQQVRLERGSEMIRMRLLSVQPNENSADAWCDWNETDEPCDPLLVYTEAMQPLQAREIPESLRYSDHELFSAEFRVATATTERARERPAVE